MIHQNLNVRIQVIRETRDKQDNLIHKMLYTEKKHLIETSAQKICTKNQEKLCLQNKEYKTQYLVCNSISDKKNFSKPLQMTIFTISNTKN